jgi:hypothetical protein
MSPLVWKLIVGIVGALLSFVTWFSTDWGSPESAFVRVIPRKQLPKPRNAIAPGMYDRLFVVSGVFKQNTLSPVSCTHWMVSPTRNLHLPVQL